MLIDPPILFCDEPTTGLDTFSALSVIKALKSLAHDTTSMDDIDSDGPNVDRDATPSMSPSNVSNEMEMSRNSVEQKHRTIGKAIMCSIHHPTAELFEIFTHVILMHSGRMAFQGTLLEAQEFFMR